MAIKEGDFVRLEFTGRTKETGDVFDTTIEEVAEEAGIKIDEKVYGPIPIIVGGGHLLKGIDQAIIDMEAGEQKTIELTPEDGFGDRDPKLVQLVPMKEFKKQNIKPYVGMNITVEGHNGRIQSISGGRVRLDFNHELAGKNLEYQVEIKEILEDDVDKIKSMIQLHYPNPKINMDKTEVNIQDGKVTIIMDELSRFDQKSYMDITFARFRIAKDIWENIENLEKVEFADVFEKKKEMPEGGVTEEEVEEIAEEVLTEVKKEKED
ncbi:peptidylprolyl isomerase [Methanobacterium alkalithermotolerans]|uniref:Peptidyl-prolyl cis-trans isomerase n=1 Tax=Methanobacterium alkalithermotolerans TaxID=2731220 RepID=A0A8T8K5F1_9EURY|nr:peptidylprolyl isomerase [Methanobacterium alkalithermotolerans]QUH23139.1 peptidylprolyl isomerase [Methanobacterium alkalithermotolerans]RJS48362.1 MAG: peptidylprolyl isomerase [Methanobacterium sp.]